MNQVTRTTLSLCAGLAIATCAHAQIAVGTGPNTDPLARLFNGSAPTTFSPYAASFQGGVRIAVGDINGDGSPDVITGTGAGGPGHVKVFDGTSGSELRSFFAYGGFSGGVHVAAGDLNGDGIADIVTGADAGAAGGHVKVFDGANGAEIRSFFAFDGFSGGVRVAAGDVNGDGRADIITSTGVGATGHVKVFSGNDGSLLRSFFSYAPGFQGGVYVASGDVNGDGFADIITGTGSDGATDIASHVKVFSGQTGAELSSFFAYDPSFLGGVRVAAGDLNGDGFADIITGAGPGGSPHVKVFNGSNGSLAQSFFAFGPNVTDGVYVAAIPSPGALALCTLGALAAATRRRP